MDESELCIIGLTIYYINMEVILNFPANRLYYRVRKPCVLKIHFFYLLTKAIRDTNIPSESRLVLLSRNMHLEHLQSSACFVNSSG